MVDVVEEMAKALAFCETTNPWIWDDKIFGEVGREFYRKKARAVLKAMPVNLEGNSLAKYFYDEMVSAQDKCHKQTQQIARLLVERDAGLAPRQTFWGRLRRG